MSFALCMRHRSLPQYNGQLFTLLVPNVNNNDKAMGVGKNKVMPLFDEVAHGEQAKALERQTGVPGKRN